MPPASMQRPVRHALVLPYSTSSVSEARRIVRKDLRNHGAPDDLIDDALTVLSELVANAVLHARPTRSGGIQVVWRRRTPTRIEVEVTDGGGRVAPHLVPGGQTATSGRGLAIVSALSREWGVLPRADGVTVYATVGS